MKKNILQQVGTREEQYTVTVIDTPESVDELTGETISAVTHEETRTRIVPVMTSVTVDMTAEEEAEMLAHTPEPVENEQSRLDEIEAALMELASLMGGAE